MQAMTFSSHNQHLFFFLVLLLSIAVAIKGDEFIAQQCGKNFTDDSTLAGSINSVILDLTAKASAQNFTISTHGIGNNTVYGISECREDANDTACFACITAAAQHLRASCPNSADSRIWYHACFLRYDTDNFIGQPDVTKVGVWLSQKEPTDEQAFTQAADELLMVLGMATAYEQGRKFGFGEIQIHNLQDDIVTIYGMTECTSDLKTSACVDCLNAALKIREASCNRMIGCFVITTSCSMRYEANKFLFNNVTIDSATSTRSIQITTL